MSRELVLKWPIPETVDKSLEKEIVNHTKEEVVLNLFKEGKISLGYGVDLLATSLTDFMDLLKRKKIPFTAYTKRELDIDQKAVKKMLDREREKK